MQKIKAICYSRVTGFYTPIDQWNKGKQAEYNNRLFYKIPGGLNEKKSVVE